MTGNLYSPIVEKIIFGSFEFNPGLGQLTHSGILVHLRKRELGILEILTGKAGEFVSEAELIAWVWRGHPVSEVTLRVQMAGLLRALGEDVETTTQGKLNRPAYIQFKQGTGYRFECLAPGIGVLKAPDAIGIKSHNLPNRKRPLFGRGAALDELKSLLDQSRVVSVVADGGTGKTALALAAADRVLTLFRDGVWLIDLAGVDDPSLVVDKVTSALDIPTIAASRKAELTKWLLKKDILLVLDNCEQVVKPVGDLISDILRDCRDVHFLTTTRIPLNIEGENVLSLRPLEVPPSAPLTADLASTYPAFAFFVDSLRSNGRAFDLDAYNFHLIVRLCQSLNGNPLAIELAAAQMCILGATSFSAEPEILSAKAIEIASTWRRQDTILALLQWSYDGLSPDAKRLFACLSVCRHKFTRGTALAIAAGPSLPEDEVLVGLTELSSKSLIVAGELADPIVYHMLVPVREFAVSKFRTLSNSAEVLHRHARNCLEQLHSSVADGPDQDNVASIDDIRAAIEWSFSDNGDALTGLHLISLVVDSKKKLYGIQDYARQLDQALARYEELEVKEPRLELRIIVERMCINQHGTNDSALMAALKTRAFELARGIYSETGDAADLLSVHQIAFSLAFSDGNGPEKKLYAREMMELSAQPGNEAVTEILAARIGAQAHHFMGEHSLAVPIIHKIMAMSDTQIRQRINVPGDRVDPRITLGIFNARTSWLLGSPEQATAQASALVETVRANWDYVLCYVTAFSALPIAIWRGDLAGARGHLNDLHTRASDFNLDYWANWAECYARALAFFESGRLTLSHPLQAQAPNNMQTDLLATFHESLLTPSAVKRVEAGYVGWCAPEVLRGETDRSLAAGTLTAIEAEEQLLRAMALAEHQGALAWQLRIATSLGRLWRYQGKSSEARSLLSATVDRFSEGFSDTDFLNAIALLKDLQS